jgi:hypothetical protein
MLESYLPLKDMQDKFSFRKYANPNQLLSDRHESILRKKRIVESMRRIVTRMSSKKAEDFEFFISMEAKHETGADDGSTKESSCSIFKLSRSCPAEILTTKTTVSGVESEKSISEKVLNVKFNLESAKTETEQKDATKSPQQQQPKKRVNVALASMMSNPMPLQSSSNKTSSLIRPPTIPQQGPLLNQPNLPRQPNPMANFSNMPQSNFPNNPNQRSQAPLLHQFPNANMPVLNQNQQQQSFFPSASTRQFNQQPTQMAMNPMINNNNFMAKHRTNNTQQQQQNNNLLLSKPNQLLSSNINPNNLNNNNMNNNGFPAFLPNLSDTPNLNLNNQSEKLEQMIRNFEMQQKQQQQQQAQPMTNNKNLLQQLQQQQKFNQSFYNNSLPHNASAYAGIAGPQQQQVGNAWPNTADPTNESYMSNLLLKKLILNNNVSLNNPNQLQQQQPNMTDFNLNMMNYLSTKMNSSDQKAASSLASLATSSSSFLSNSLDHTTNQNQALSGIFSKKQTNLASSLNANMTQKQQQQPSNPSIWSYPSSSSQNSK